MPVIVSKGKTESCKTNSQNLSHSLILTDLHWSIASVEWTQWGCSTGSEIWVLSVDPQKSVISPRGVWICSRCLWVSSWDQWLTWASFPPWQWQMCKGTSLNMQALFTSLVKEFSGNWKLVLKIWLKLWDAVGIVRRCDTRYFQYNSPRRPLKIKY